MQYVHIYPIRIGYIFYLPHPVQKTVAHATVLYAEHVRAHLSEHKSDTDIATKVMHTGL